MWDLSRKGCEADKMSEKIKTIESKIVETKRELRRLEFELSQLLNEKFVSDYNSGGISKRQELLQKGG